MWPTTGTELSPLPRLIFCPLFVLLNLGIRFGHSWTSQREIESGALIYSGDDDGHGSDMEVYIQSFALDRIQSLDYQCTLPGIRVHCALSPLLVGLIAMGLCTSQWTDNKKGSSRNVSNGPQFIPLCGFLFASHSLTGEEGRNGGITAALLLRTYFTA